MVKFDVVTFGSGVVDVFASTGINEKKGKLDLDVGVKYLIDGLKFDVGGGGTNVAVAFARFGLKTGCICGVGRDSNGDEVLKSLKKEGVKFLGKVREGHTGYSVIVDSKKRNRTVLTYKGESNEVSGVRKFRSGWLYYSSLLGVSFESQKRLAREFVRGGGKLVLNPSSYFVEKVGTGKFDIRGLLRLCHVLVLNKEEAGILCRRYGKKGDLLKGLRSLGPRIVVITDKNRRVVCYDGKEEYFIVPHSKVKVVERTGAGDAFAAGVVAGLIAGHSIDECLKLAVEESEAVLGHFGAKNNLIKRKLVRRR